MKLDWNTPGSRLFEVGCDRGVLFPPNKKGVAWNGLIGVNQQPSGGEPVPRYLDGVKYMNKPSREEFVATLEAYYYPDEFAPHNGFPEVRGFGYDQQERLPFDLSYRTIIGNDLEAQDYGHLIHLLYNVIASPTSRSYKTLTDQSTPLTLSWKLSTTPIRLPGRRPTAHFTINTTQIHPNMLTVVESFLYGTATTPPQLLRPHEWEELLGKDVFTVVPDPNSPYWPLVDGEYPDVVGTKDSGMYQVPPGSRLQNNGSGLYKIG